MKMGMSGWREREEITLHVSMDTFVFFCKASQRCCLHSVGGSGGEIIRIVEHRLESKDTLRRCPKHGHHDRQLLSLFIL